MGASMKPGIHHFQNCKLYKNKQFTEFKYKKYANFIINYFLQARNIGLTIHRVVCSYRKYIHVGFITTTRTTQKKTTTKNE